MRQNETTRIWTAGFHPCFRLPGFCFGHLSLTRSHRGWLDFLSESLHDSRLDMTSALQPSHLDGSTPCPGRRGQVPERSRAPGRKTSRWGSLEFPAQTRKAPFGVSVVTSTKKPQLVWLLHAISIRFSRKKLGYPSNSSLMCVQDDLS